MVRWICRVSSILAFSIGIFYSPHTVAQQSVVVAVVTDGPQFQLQDVERIFRTELQELLQGEFDLKFELLIAGWSANSVSQAMQQAYADNSVDMVLVLGIAANQLVVSRQSFPKPTFLPLVFNPEIIGAPVDENRSGLKNLNYLADRIPVEEDLAAFQRVSSFTNAVLVSDTVIIDSIPAGPAAIRQAGNGIDFSFVGHDGVDHNLVAKIPNNTEAVLLGGLPRMPAELFEGFLLDLAERGIRVFSLVSEAEVNRGALASYTTLTDFRRLARRNALNMQAVLIGERAQDQPVFFDGKRQLTINMDTARRIGLSPRFDVLSEAELVNARAISTGPMLDLERVARLAVARNLNLAAEKLNIAIGQQDVAAARSGLLPQISINGSTTARRSSDLIRTPGNQERASAGALTLSQVIYSESIRSGYQQQQLLQKGREANYSAAVLDQIFEATTAFLQALRADTQLAIQRENLSLSKSNLDLAKDRVRIGSASKADVYRWEANLAAARSNALAALATRQQARELINRLLHQPLNQPLNLQAPKKDTPFSLTTDEFDDVIDNPLSFQWFTEFSIQQGLNTSHELRELQAQLDALDRDIAGKRREYWLPQVSVQAQYLDSIAASGGGSGSSLDSIDDWNVSLNASLPLFAGNSRRTALQRSTIQKQRLEILKDATAERIEQSIRASLHAAQSSYINIELSQTGADASRKNLELVSQAYKLGSLSILDLLDAQNQSLQADLAANNAVHDFLIDIMNYQRSKNEFDFLLSREEKAASKDALLQYIKSRNATENNTTGDQP